MVIRPLGQLKERTPLIGHEVSRDGGTEAAAPAQTYPAPRVTGEEGSVGQPYAPATTGMLLRPTWRAKEAGQVTAATYGLTPTNSARLPGTAGNPCNRFLAGCCVPKGRSEVAAHPAIHHSAASGHFFALSANNSPPLESHDLRRLCPSGSAAMDTFSITY